MNELAAVKVIKTDEQHAQAVAHLLRLMEADDNSNNDTIELLALVIEDYERKASPTPSVDPVDAIRFRMDQMGMSAKDLAPYLGSQSKVSDVLNGKRPLTLAMMRNLHKGLGIPADVLLNESPIDIDLNKPALFDYTSFPLKEMAKRGCFGTKYIAASLPALSDIAEELIRKTFGDFLSADMALLRAPQTQTGTRAMNDMALLAWVAIVKKQALAEPIETSYTQGVITKEWLSELVKLSEYTEGPKLAKEYLARYGIVLVVEPHFKKTYLDGAAMLLGDRAVVGVTLRYDRLDHFWFVLIHELAHVQKHLSPAEPIVMDDLDDKTQRAEQQEAEADEIAQEALIPMEAWQASMVKNTYAAADALKLAQQLNISPAIVAGRVRKETGNWRLLHNMLGKDVVKAMFKIS